MKLMNSDYDLPVNLGNPDEYTVKVGLYVLYVWWFGGRRRVPVTQWEGRGSVRERLKPKPINQPTNQPNPQTQKNPPQNQDFALLVRELVGGGSEIVHLPATQDDPSKRRPDIAVAKEVRAFVCCAGGFCGLLCGSVIERKPTSLHGPLIHATQSEP